MTATAKSERKKPKPEYVEGPKALRNFTDTMTKLFRVPKSEIQEAASTSPHASTVRHKTKKAEG